MTRGEAAVIAAATVTGLLLTGLSAALWLLSHPLDTFDLGDELGGILGMGGGE